MIFKFRKQNYGKTEAKPKLVSGLKLNQNNKGFSLIEMIVVVAIIIVITSILLLNQSKFSSDILVTNAAYEVALSIRQAQVYGISSKQSTGPIKNVGYGVYLSSSFTPQNYFILYSDSGSGSGSTYPFNFDPSLTGEYSQVDRPELTQGQTIKKFCADGVCSVGTGALLTSLDIGFLRPNPEAQIHANGSQSKSGSAIIVVASSLGDKCRVVRITSIGQISVDAPVTVGSDCDQTQ